MNDRGHFSLFTLRFSLFTFHFSLFSFSAKVQFFIYIPKTSEAILKVFVCASSMVESLGE